MEEKLHPQFNEPALTEDLLQRVIGGGAFDDVPTVEEHDYDDDIRQDADVPPVDINAES